MQVRNTQQRKLILELMTDNFSHPTADEVYELARKREPHISRGTVYRNLNFLAESGNIVKIIVPGGADHYDSKLERHYHFYCRSCRRLFDVPSVCSLTLDAIPAEMEKSGFLVEGHNLIFTGTCPNCSV